MGRQLFDKWANLHLRLLLEHRERTRKVVELWVELGARTSERMHAQEEKAALVSIGAAPF